MHPIRPIASHSRLSERKRSGFAVVALFLSVTARADEIHVRNFAQVNQNLFRGAQPDDRGLIDLQRLGIHTVVDLRQSGEGYRNEAETAKRLGMQYIHVPLREWGSPSEDQIRFALAAIEEKANAPVFLHCRRGKDRTGTVVACYRISEDKWSPQRALEEADEYGMSHLQHAMRRFILSFAAPGEMLAPSWVH